MTVIDLTAMNTLKEDLGEDILKQALALITKELQEAETIFRECLANNDFHTFSRKAHSLKGSSMSFGFINLKQILFDLERASCDKQDTIKVDFIRRKLDAFKNERDYILAEINKI